MVKDKKRNCWLLILGLFSILTFLFLPIITQAQVLPPCTATGNCGLCDFIQTFVNIIRWTLGVIGGLALLLMVWHGFSWLTSGGNAEKVEAGKKGLIHTILGVLIIIGSWFIVNIVIVILLTSPSQATGGISVQNLFSGTAGSTAWYKFCGGENEGPSPNLCKQGWGEGTPCNDDGGFCLLRCQKPQYDPDDKNKIIGCTEEKNICSNTNYANGVLNGYMTKKTYENTCQYWSCHPARSEYRHYNCTTQSTATTKCIPGKILGPEYCDSTTGGTCCALEGSQGYHDTQGGCP